MRLSVREVPARDVGVEESSSVRPGRSDAEVIPCSCAKVSSRIWRRNSSAFFDDDAAATRMPGVLDGDDEPQRVGVGGELAGLDELDHHLLLALGVLEQATRSSASGTWKYSSAARAPLIRGLPDISSW